MHVVLIDDGNLLLLPDTLLRQLAKIWLVGMEAAKHWCEYHVHVLPIVLWNFFHFDVSVELNDGVGERILHGGDT